MIEQVNAFEIPSHLNASIPAEKRGCERDDVRLMVLDRLKGDAVQAEFRELPDYLEAGDVLVLNNSRTIPAVLTGRQGQRKVEVRLSRKIEDGVWDALIVGDLARLDQAIEFSGGVMGEATGEGIENPLVRLRFSVKGNDFADFLYRQGEPVRYEYIKTPWPLEVYQNVYGSVPGSVEMASAGRAFSWRLIRALKAKGVKITFVQLHTGLSYYGEDRWPNPTHHPEAYAVTEEAVDVINEAKKQGRRVIAVGTTVVRALETAARNDGGFSASRGLTDLYIRKTTSLQVVDGLLTGFHEPEASHLEMLGAFVEQDVLMKAYESAVVQGYKWHEFGDVNLIL